MSRSIKPSPANASLDALPRSYPELLLHIGGRVRELREMLGMTLTELGPRIGLDPGGMSRLERGKANFTFRIADRIAAGLGVPTHELFIPRAISELDPVALRARRGAPGPIRDLHAEEASLEQLLERIGGRIRELRTLQGLSIAVLADYAEVVPHQLNSIELGRWNCSVRIIDRIAQGIGVHTYELVLPRERSELQVSLERSAKSAPKKRAKTSDPSATKKPTKKSSAKKSGKKATAKATSKGETRRAR